MYFDSTWFPCTVIEDPKEHKRPNGTLDYLSWRVKFDDGEPRTVYGYGIHPMLEVQADDTFKKVRAAPAKVEKVELTPA
jgi:hypothetical protein